MKLKNINKYKSLLLAATAAVVATACSLTEVPRDNQVVGDYSSPKDVEQAVIGAYSRLRNVADNVYLNLSEVRSDNMWVNPTPNGNREYSEIGTFRAGATSSYINGTWEMFYQVIYAVNTILDNIDSVEFPDDTDQVSLREQLRGEALFLRGYSYFELARLYGRVPVFTSLLPLEESRKVGQSDVGTVFARATEDLLAAERVLPEPGQLLNSAYSTNGTLGRADRIAAKAMLGRAYMQMAGFPINDSGAQALAETKIKEVLDYATSNGKYWAPDIKEWRRQFMMNGNNAYSIFAIQYTTGGYGNTAIFNFSNDIPGSYYNRVANTIYLFSNDIWVEKSLQYEYTVEQSSTGERDLRGFDWTVMNGYEAEGTFDKYVNQQEELDYGQGVYETYTRSFYIKFLDMIQKRAALDLNYTPEDGMVRYDDWPINHPVIRLEDMMLLYAEILVDKGRIADALQYVNDIRQRAGVDPVPTGVSAAVAMDYIKRERRLELVGEGVRWFDMIRYGEWRQDILDMVERYGGQQDGVTLSNISENRYYYPIPSTQMEYGIYTQNAGY